MTVRKIKIHEGDTFSPLKTFDCGQSFRFEERDGVITGVVGKTLLKIRSDESVGYIEYQSSDPQGVDLFFDPNNKYSEMFSDFFESFEGRSREALVNSEKTGRGIRILKQNFWETLVSFIISQNNNIPRIKKNVYSICKTYGEAFEVDGELYYAFPTPEALLKAGTAALEELRLGFRAKYIIDAAKKVASGEIDEKELMALDTESASKKLQTIHGVGPKVAACVLLYGLGRLETVPVDVWMKKVFAKYFDSYPDLGRFGGVAQQYLFYTERFIIEGK